MVRRQAKSVKKERQATLLLFQYREELLIVSVFMESCVPVITTRDDVIETSLEFNARLAGHDRRILRTLLRRVIALLQGRAGFCGRSIDLLRTVRQPVRWSLANEDEIARIANRRRDADLLKIPNFKRV